MTQPTDAGPGVALITPVVKRSLPCGFRDCGEAAIVGYSVAQLTGELAACPTHGEAVSELADAAVAVSGAETLVVEILAGREEGDR